MIKLSDDGTMDTVVCCDKCDEEFRFNFQSADIDESDDSEADYDAFVAECIAEIEAEHECPNDRHEYVGRSGRVEIRLNFDDRDNCYDGMVKVDGHTYSVSVGRPKSTELAADSDEAFRAAAHAALSFAADDKEWSQGEDIFTPAAEMDANGWVVTKEVR